MHAPLTVTPSGALVASFTNTSALTNSISSSPELSAMSSAIVKVLAAATLLTSVSVVRATMSSFSASVERVDSW